MKLKFIFTLQLVLLSIWAMAQPRNAKIETIGGKEYYVHAVKKGETLYEIAKDYKSPLADVLNANPGKEAKIDIGDKIKIPVTAKNRIKPVTAPPVTQNNNVPKPEPVTIIDYTVEKGETIYGIAKKFKTTPDDIYALNPEAKNGISTGTVLKVPTTEKVTVTKVVKPAEPRVMFEHTVLPQETFFSLSRKYNISADSIKLLNNGLPDGLKAGNTIQLAVPISKVAQYKSCENTAPNTGPLVTPGNSLPVKPDTVKTNIPESASVFKTGKKSVYNVGMILPFNLDKNKQVMESQNPLERKSLYEPTRQALDFYHGVLLALDSLKKAGISTNLRVFDVGKDSVGLRRILLQDDFKSLDLLIGPFECIDQVAKAAKENKIPMTVPVACSNRVLLDNPFVFKSIPTSTVIAEETSRYIINHYKNDNLILVDGKGKNDVGVLKSYSRYLNKFYMAQTGKTDSIKARPIDFMSTNAITALLRKDKINVFIVPSNEYAFVSATLSNLNKFLARSYHKEYRVVVFGTDEWVKYDQIDITHKLRANVHVPSPTFVDFDTLQTQRLTQSFRERFASDPDKYAMMGFDLAYFWLSGYATKGLEFAGMVQHYDITMSQTRFVFQKMNENSGCLNRNVYILRYHDYKLTPELND